MYQFFITESRLDESGRCAVITGDDRRHIADVLRMKPGEALRISTRESGRSFFGKVAEITPEQVVVTLTAPDEAGTELPCRIVLFQGLPKGDKFEQIIQKSVELGAAQIVPVAMQNCVMRIDESKADRKLVRWRGIAESAAKQSKRSVIPEINPPQGFAQALDGAKGLTHVLVAYEKEQGGMETLRSRLCAIRVTPETSIGIWIGPEGGFSDAELAALDAAGDSFCRISLGRRILRTETAGPALLSILTYELEL